MTSFGCNELTMAGFNPSFRIQGQVYHLIGSIVLTQGESPKFVQIYFIDDLESEIATRSAIVDGLKPDIVRGINQLLHESNHYVEVFKVAKEIFKPGARGPQARFLEIISSANVGVCVCVSAPKAINNKPHKRHA